jgi:NitT/TauT family transport system permease protein
MKRSLVAILFFASLIILWQALVSAEIWSPVLLPSPLDVARYLWAAILDGSLIEGSWVTMKRLLLGYLIGCAIGLPLGLATARSKYLSDTIGVPLALLWFGQSESAMLFVVIMGTLWSVLIAVDNGARSLPPIYVRAARTMGSSGLHTLIKVILPASLPFVVGGMKQGWAFAWRSLMAAEIYVTLLTGYGLGHLLHFGRELNAMDQVIGIMLVIVLIGLAADKVLFSPWERFLQKRWGTGS